MGIKEKKMETTIMGYIGFRGLRVLTLIRRNCPLKGWKSSGNPEGGNRGTRKLRAAVGGIKGLGFRV